MHSENFLNTPAIQNVLAEMEITRKEIAKKQIISTVLAVIGILIGFGGYFFQSAMVYFIAIGVSIFIASLIVYTSTTAKDENYRKNFKEKIIAQVLKLYDESVTIRFSIGLAEREFKDTQLFAQDPDRYHSEDLVTGKLDKTSFYFGEVHAEYKTEVRTKNGSTTRWHDIFKGIIFTADFNKHFTGGTIVRPRNMFSGMSTWFSFGSAKPVELENVNFQKTFITQSSDQVEARYLLTPALMERILLLDEKSEETISLSFCNSKVYIAFPIYRNCFEPPKFKSLLNPKILEADLNVIDAMMAIIHELDLNTRIWTKD